ncbi:MAG: hypothetical protein Ct9H300mP7_6330 [Verrucomicrobiota bacterium]|nr:MAG: hypothetical protein Ct9H300mP7_6330 [Verrucomicrobiota bacterium]
MSCAGGFSFYFILQAFLQYKAPGMPAAEPSGTTQPSQRSGGHPGESYRGAPVDYAIMIGYFLVIVIMGVFFGRKMKSTDDFFLAAGNSPGG